MFWGASVDDISIKANNTVNRERTLRRGKVAKAYLAVGIFEAAAKVRGLALAVRQF
jgi:hypothetical protein